MVLSCQRFITNLDTIMLSEALVGEPPALGVQAEQTLEAVAVGRGVGLAAGQPHHHVSPVHGAQYLHLPVVVERVLQLGRAQYCGRAGAVGWVEHDLRTQSYHNLKQIKQTNRKITPLPLT